MAGAAAGGAESAGAARVVAGVSASTRNDISPDESLMAKARPPARAREVMEALGLDLIRTASYAEGSEIATTQALYCVQRGRQDLWEAEIALVRRLNAIRPSDSPRRLPGFGGFGA